MTTASRNPVFVADDELGYARARTLFAPGAGLALDDAYRLAHLPLVAPDHPKAIARRDGRDYVMGRHGRVFSLVLPVPSRLLAEAPAFRRLEAELRASRCGAKIAWDLLPRRASKLHATICGSLGAGDHPPAIGGEIRDALRRIGPVEIELRGLFSGATNVGRLYLRVYPERRRGENVLRAIQRCFGRPETDLYLVGLYNLVDDLDPLEAEDLAHIVEAWWNRPLLRVAISELWLLGACDDLVLESAVAESIALVGGNPPGIEARAQTL